MEWTVHQLAKLSGVSGRTLRYYHSIGLLMPLRTAESGYRVYGQSQVDRLQQILFYRELGVSLEDIQRILDDPAFDPVAALEGHLEALAARQAQLDCLLSNVRRTLGALKGENDMTDQEKFEGFKREQIEANDRRYGQEVKARYGQGIYAASQERVKGMTQAQWEAQEALGQEILAELRQLAPQGEPAGALAQALCAKHEKWLRAYWPQGAYTRSAHLGLAEGYVADERFRAYYDGDQPGCAAFLRDALAVYCSQE